MRYHEVITEADRPNRPFEDAAIVVYPQDRVVFHTTNAEAGQAIRQQGFRTGKELDVNERRDAVYFADRDVNPGLYARNDRPGEPYHGQHAMVVAANIKGLRLLNLTYREHGTFILHTAYRRMVVRGELSLIPMFQAGQIDGTILYLTDGRIYEVCLPRDIANRVIQR